MAGIHDVQHQVSLFDLLQRGAESRYELGWQLADKADCVGEYDLLTPRRSCSAAFSKTFKQLLLQ